jgi:hypothetical protein
MNSARRWFKRRLTPRLPYPYYLFGGFITVYSGQWADVHLPHTNLVICWRRNRRYAFLSKDGTPRNRIWGIGRAQRARAYWLERAKSQ